jgi:hypothetical protein
MSIANRSNRPNTNSASTVKEFNSTRSKMIHLSKPIVANPKFDPKVASNTEAPLAVSKLRGHTYVRALVGQPA